MAIKTMVANVPSVTRALVLIVLSLSISSYVYIYRLQLEADPDTPVLSICPFIGLLPGFVIYAPWTFLTAAFYESNIVTLLLSVVILLLCGKYLERAWGSKELLKFVLVSAVLSNVVTWFGILISYYLSGDDKFLYQIQINGMSGVFSAFLVAFKHLIPEHRIAMMGGKISIRVKNLLGVVTAISIISLILFKAIVFYNLVNIGWVVGWIYIRFFKYQDGIQGDQSETFAIQTFFPEFLHPVILFISNIVYGVLVKVRCCKPGPRPYHDVEIGHVAPVPGSARAEAERRRALALKALDMRLSSKPSSSEPKPDNPVLFDAEQDTQP
ncbi:eukaryotic integral membrane protein-domain-containing protein [Gilbertella persicaria]|uniref:eukaryotic integral membrane protein-domain-containing protein n=1 Tax=Gilbertella persicaria TaxID=101096 RepID=UPI00221EBFD2|nr:eukaryotic integral membrane protein-domain-containing protein [Gilbertella persicaria]KAI8049441.1 eukaryotic integral membrane protein-domain-containing protein [Gilbertella persicaria]